MKTGICQEPYALACSTPYDENILRLTWNDLKTAPVGTVWSYEDQDKYPNRGSVWDVTYTKVFENADGCAMVRTSTAGDEPDELTWFAYAK